VGTLRIRRARRTDLDVLIRELGQRRFFTDRFARQSAGRGMLLTAWRGARPIGVLYLWLEPAEEAELRTHLPGTPILNHLEIHADHRGGGTGTKLMRAAERRLRKLGFGQVALAVEVTNKRAARYPTAPARPKKSAGSWSSPLGRDRWNRVSGRPSDRSSARTSGTVRRFRCSLRFSATLVR
jgi:GNAT superfamily N-acetyltransferase